MIQKNINDAYIHRSLFGEAATAKKEYRKLVTRAVRMGTWRGLINRDDLFPVLQLPESYAISLAVGSGQNAPLGVLFHGFPVIEEMRLAAAKWSGTLGSDRNSQCARRLHELTVEGCQEFWFVLGVLADAHPWLLPGSPLISKTENPLARDILFRILPWFEVLDSVSNRLVDRFNTGWLDWGTTILGLCYQAGLGERTQLLTNMSLPELQREIEALVS